MYCELVDAKIAASDKDLPVTSMSVSFDVADLVNWFFPKDTLTQGILVIVFFLISAMSNTLPLQPGLSERH